MECLPSMRESLSLIRTQEEGAGGSEVQGHTQLHNKFKVSLSYAICFFFSKGRIRYVYVGSWEMFQWLNCLLNKQDA